MATRASVKGGHAYILIEAIDKTQAVFKNVNQRLNHLSRGFLIAGAQAGLFGAALAVPLASTVRSVRDFSDELLYLQSKLNISSDAMTSLIDKIKELGRTGSFTAKEVATAATALAEAGFGQGTIEGLLDKVINLARGGRIALDEAANFLANTLVIFHPGQEVENAEKTVDAFFIAAKNGTINMYDLAASMPYVAQSAKTMGLSVQELTAALSAMSLMGIKGSLAGTSLNQLLISSATQAEKLNEELGFTAFTKEGGVKGFLDMITDLGKQLRGLTTEQKLSLVNKLFNVRGARATGLVDMIERVNASIKEMQKTSGIAARASELLDSKIGGSIRRILAAFDSLKNATEPTFTAVFKAFEDKIVPVVRGVAVFMQNNQQLARDMIKTFAVVSAFAVGMTTIGIGFRVAAIAVGGFASVIRILTAPFRLAISLATKFGVQLLTVGFRAAEAAISIGLMAVTTTTRLVTALISTTASITSAFGALAAFAALGPELLAIAAIALVIGTTFVQLGKLVNSSAEAIRKLPQALMYAFKSISEAIADSLADISRVIDMFWGTISGKLEKGDFKGAMTEGMVALRHVWEVTLIDMKIMWTQLVTDMRVAFHELVVDVKNTFHDVMQLYRLAQKANPINIVDPSGFLRKSLGTGYENAQRLMGGRGEPDKELDAIRKQTSDTLKSLQGRRDQILKNAQSEAWLLEARKGAPPTGFSRLGPSMVDESGTSRGRLPQFTPPKAVEPPVFSTVLPAALERGTLEAAKQAAQNQMNQVTLLGSIDSSLKTIVQQLREGGAGTDSGPAKEFPIPFPVGVGR